MRDDSLSDMLRHAANASGTSGEQEIDLDGVRAAVRRAILRRNAVRVIGIVAFCTLAGLLAFNSLSKSNEHKPMVSPPIVVRTPDGGTDKDSAAVIIDVRQRIADAVQIKLDHLHAQAWAEDADPVDPAAARDEAARTMVLVAQKRAELIDKHEAVELYRRAIAIFPETQWAAVADQEIKQLSKTN